jgi:tRNA nucleotidyltransferase (CCA-adding enzyme)
MTVKIWEVGGHVRDSLLGVVSKDVDMAVECSGYEEMREFVIANTREIFLEKPEFLTIRAMGNDGLPKDFVLCRKDGTYSDGRRPDSVEPGTILDDLHRRDFTINAIARDTDTGELFDPFGGVADLKAGLIKCVGMPEDRFNEDSLRILRALRFKITKGFMLDKSIRDVLVEDARHWTEQLKNISPERIREEVLKCFRHDTVEAMVMFNWLYRPMREVIFNESGIWLKPTMEGK